ncbi:MAG: HTH-type transcriptional repressor NagR [Eubacterium sp.]|uniref:GntR family transcriptional regulator n=1 Tax=Eubacterium sp. TaxID=142586 RepID=UPI00305DDD6F
MGAPEYIKIVEAIKNKITSQELEPGDAIQSENLLCEEFNVSRMTVRKGLAVLVNEGYIYSIPGKGNYVCEPDLDQYILHYNEMAPGNERGDEVRLIEVNVVKPSYEVGFNLEIPETKHVIVVKRVFLKDGFPTAYDIKYIPYYRGIPIVEKEIRYATFPEMVAKKNSIFAMTKKLKIRAAIAEDETARNLEIPVGMPLLVVEEKLLDEKDKPIGWGMMYLAGEDAGLEAVASFD